MRRTLWPLGMLILCALSACSAADSADTAGAGNGNGGSSDAGENSGDAQANGGGQPGPTSKLKALAIEPALAELESIDGSRPEQVFKVVGTLEDGTKTGVPSASFSLESIAFGAITEGSGKFVATGVAGGETKVLVEAPGVNGTLTAEATVRVALKRVVLGAGVTVDMTDRFKAPATADATVNLLYPLEGALMPQNVFPADAQWLTGNAGDVFEISLEKPNASVRAYVVHSGAGFGNHYLFDIDGWRAIAQSDPDAPAVVRLKRWDVSTMQVLESPTVSFKFARAALTGSIYYWDIAAGRIRRIDDGTNVATDFMPTPPNGASGGDRCVGCHSVSPTGRYMAGRLNGGDNTGTVFDLTTDLTGDPPPTVFATNKSYWWFSSWSPDETRMVVARGNGGGPSLAVINPLTGDDVPVTGSLPSNATQPAWSPDGTQIAYVADGNNWGDNATSGNIALLPVTGPDQFGAKQTIHAGSTLSMQMPGGNADSYPSWSPDSQKLTFTHGTGVRSDNQQGALYMMGKDGGSVVRLDKACAGAASNNNYQSRFSPFDTGEHFWISFLSKRDYGNGEAGTRGANRQQIWVAAIRKNAKPGEDPSEVAYWLPGQRTTSQNISAYWAPRPCRKDGEGCSVGSECCGGDCRPDDQGALVCAPPPPEECRANGQTCSSDADCCDGLPCVGNVCTIQIQ